MKKNSFTLIETLVAIFLLTTGIGAISTLISQSIVVSSFFLQKLTAAYLAQEGIEIVRNIRDSNLLKGENWDSGLANGDWQADYNDQSLSSYNGAFLKFDGNFYNYATGTPTSFQRKISLRKVEDILEVRVEVFWQERGRSHSLTVQENFYNWR